MNHSQNILKYFDIYIKYVGRRIYLVFALTVAAALAEGLGIALLLPLLKTLDGSGPSEGRAGKLLYEALDYIGVGDSVIGILLVIGIVFFLKGLFIFWQLGYRGYLQVKLMKDLKIRMFDAYGSMDYRYYIKRNTGHFINLINEQVNLFFSSFINYTAFICQLIMTIAYLSIAFFIAWQFALMALGAGAILIMIFRSLNSFVRKLSLRISSEMGILNKLLVQTLQGFKYIAATHQIGHLRGGVIQSINRLASYHLRQQVALAFTAAVREPASVLFIIVIVAVQILVINAPVSPIFVAVLLFYRGIGSALGIQTMWQSTMNLIGSVEMVNKEFINLEMYKESGGSVKMGQLQQGIELKDVSYAYDENGSSVLNKVSVHIPINQTTAIVGASGAGKSTLIDMLTLMLKPNSGVITIDGVPGPELELSSWRKQIGYVSQDTVIFDDSITNNISLWSDEPSIDEWVRDVAQKAHIAEFINALQNGYDTVVGDRGVRLSGGQCQRLFIARELFKEPNLLILDEATSSLDTESERYIQRSIDSLKGKMTVVIIAHRLSTIRNVDYIYVLDQGKVIEEGTYLELQNQKQSRFREMIDMQSL